MGRQYHLFFFMMYLMCLGQVIARDHEEEVGFNFVSDEKIRDFKLSVDLYLSSKKPKTAEASYPMPSVLCSKEALKTLSGKPAGHTIPKIIYTYCMERAAQKWAEKHKGKALDLRPEKGISPEDIPFILGGFKERSNNIHHLILPNLNPAIVKAFDSFSQLRKLHVESGELIEAKQLSAVIGKQIHLQFLTFDGTIISDQALEILAPKLPQSLLDLRLSGNSIGPQGAKILGEKLPRYIFTLILDDNPIGDAGLAHLGNALGNIKNLKELSLQNAGITDAGIEAFVTHLAKSNLHALSLQGNNISQNQRKAVANAMAKATGKTIHH